MQKYIRSLEIFYDQTYFEKNTIAAHTTIKVQTILQASCQKKLYCQCWFVIKEITVQRLVCLILC